MLFIRKIRSRHSSSRSATDYFNEILFQMPTNIKIDVEQMYISNNDIDNSNSIPLGRGNFSSARRASFKGKYVCVKTIENTDTQVTH